jgi:hypothetical protein
MGEVCQATLEKVGENEELGFSRTTRPQVLQIRDYICGLVRKIPHVGANVTSDKR